MRFTSVQSRAADHYTAADPMIVACPCPVRWGGMRPISSREFHYMASRLEIDQASVTDNDVARQIEFTAEFNENERDFAAKYGVLKELSGRRARG